MVASNPTDNEWLTVTFETFKPSYPARKRGFVTLAIVGGSKQCNSWRVHPLSIQKLSVTPETYHTPCKMVPLSDLKIRLGADTSRRTGTKCTEHLRANQ